jgi:hypothetical protein
MAREVKKRTMATTRREIERLEEIEKTSFALRSRLRERPYLQAVYKLYRDWREDDHSTRWSQQAAKTYGITLREDSHPIRIIIDCSSPNTDEKMRSRWTLALRHANAKGISSSKLLEFLDEEGGIAGRASEFRARQRKAAAAKNKLRCAGDGQLVGPVYAPSHPSHRSRRPTTVRPNVSASVTLGRGVRSVSAHGAARCVSAILRGRRESAHHLG